MKNVLAIALCAGAVMTGAIAGTSASAQSEPLAAQLANQLDQNGVASTYVFRGGGRGGGGGGRIGGAGFRGGHVGGVGRVGGVGGPRRVGGYGGRYGYGYGRRGWGYGGAAVAGGLAAGALVGGAVAGYPNYYGNTYGAAPVYAEPEVDSTYEQTGSVDSTAYCIQRFRSYDPGSGTYLGNDGLRHPCP
jgi:hypothetical protein